jgi:hypothetical protein
VCDLEVAWGQSESGEGGLCLRLAGEGQWVWAAAYVLGSCGLEDAVQGALAFGVVMPGVGESCLPIWGRGRVGGGIG